MIEYLNSALTALHTSPTIYSAGVLMGLIFLAALTGYFLKAVLLKLVFRALRHTSLKEWDDKGELSFIRWLAYIIPALIISEGTQLILGLPEQLAMIVGNVAQGVIVILLMLASTQALNLINDIYERSPSATNKPIKGYLQISKIIIYLIAVILIAALLINRSPVILISGLGAAAAVLMFIFQDTMLSFVASVQISSGQLIRIGDWIQMPQLNADGFVIDIALHTVKVQNWDKTITTIPTKRFISDTFINWRGMQESGGRRIKRSLLINQHSIRFLTLEDLNKLKGMKLIYNYLMNKEDEINFWNKSVEAKGAPMINYRRLTNIGTFRAYVEQYIKNHPDIRQDMTMIVRQMEPTPEGLPIEVYCFTNTVAWVNYEAIQSDIFDHLLSIVEEFGLTVYQSPTGKDFQALTQQSTSTQTN